MTPRDRRLTADELISRFGFVPETERGNSWVGILPDGFDDYICVLHRLTLESGEPVNYSEVVQHVNWSSVDQLQTQLRSEERRDLYPCEGRLDRWSCDRVVAGLRIADDAEYLATYFFDDEPIRRLDADGLLATLHETSRGPLLWFPEDVSWVASSPYDEWQTYLALDAQTAQVIMHDRGIEALRCVP